MNASGNQSGPPSRIGRESQFPSAITKDHQAKSPSVKPSQTPEKKFCCRAPQTLDLRLQTSDLRPCPVRIPLYSTLFGGDPTVPRSESRRAAASRRRIRALRKKKITKRTHFGDLNSYTTTMAYDKTVSNRKEKRTHFQQPRPHKNTSYLAQPTHQEYPCKGKLKPFTSPH